MQPSRRQFLRRLAVASAVPAAAAAGAAWYWGELTGRARRLYHRIGYGELPPGTPAPLPPPVLTTLLAAAEGLVGVGAGEEAAGGPGAGGDGFEAGPYAGLFRWRAENLPGYGELYRRFAARFDARARSLGASSFAVLAPRERRRLLAAHLPAGRFGRLRLGLVEPEDLAFRQFVTHEVLELFARTGAWRRLGYPNHPGVPRGLDAYRRALPAAPPRRS